ncbi:hypothetical protein PCURB6_26010 [Paenibacillus curdlanolyticus]|nr:hypothetical protein PCURB6_26010 [Paenibacillus curdlanolyticus]
MFNNNLCIRATVSIFDRENIIIRIQALQMDYPYNHLYYYALAVKQNASSNVRDLLSYQG